MRQFKNQLPAQSPDAKKREQIFRHPYLSFILLGVILILILNSFNANKRILRHRQF